MQLYGFSIAAFPAPSDMTNPTEPSRNFFEVIWHGDPDAWRTLVAAIEASLRNEVDRRPVWTPRGYEAPEVDDGQWTTTDRGSRRFTAVAAIVDLAFAKLVEHDPGGLAEVVRHPDGRERPGHLEGPSNLATEIRWKGVGLSCACGSYRFSTTWCAETHERVERPHAHRTCPVCQRSWIDVFPEPGQLGDVWRTDPSDL